MEVTKRHEGSRRNTAVSEHRGEHCHRRTAVWGGHRNGEQKTTKLKPRSRPHRMFMA